MRDDTQQTADTLATEIETGDVNQLNTNPALNGVSQTDKQTIADAIFTGDPGPVATVLTRTVLLVPLPLPLSTTPGM